MLLQQESRVAARKPRDAAAVLLVLSSSTTYVLSLVCRDWSTFSLRRAGYLDRCSCVIGRMFLFVFRLIDYYAIMAAVEEPVGRNAD